MLGPHICSWFSGNLFHLDMLGKLFIDVCHVYYFSVLLCCWFDNRKSSKPIKSDDATVFIILFLRTGIMLWD